MTFTMGLLLGAALLLVLIWLLALSLRLTELADVVHHHCHRLEELQESVTDLKEQLRALRVDHSQLQQLTNDLYYEQAELFPRVDHLRQAMIQPRKGPSNCPPAQ